MDRFAYPRTYHLPWSPGATSDDKIIRNANQFANQLIVVTEKRDGENTTLYADGYVHARSVDGTGKEYQSWITRKWREVCWSLDADVRICGENLFARHSIAYEDLKSFFEVFGIYKGDLCLNWSDTKLIASKFGLELVPTLYVGLWDEKVIRQLCEDVVARGGEGLVVRNTDSFTTANFSLNVAKYVRANHVTTNEHWTKNWVPNTLETK
ncbi:RNA ligase [compost metagenome]